MIPVTAKIETLREAVAEGWVRLQPPTLLRLAANDLPKKDVLPTARAAALLAAKRVPEAVPHCHPIPLDEVAVDLEPMEGGVRVRARTVAVAKTGVEVEALAAVQAACLVIFDMLKPVQDGIVIEGVRVLEKSGGKADFQPHLKPGYRAAVVVASDRVAAGLAEDKTGPAIVAALEGWGVAQVERHVLPDDQARLSELFVRLAAAGTDLVLSTGGTGLSPRDRTVEAVRAVIERELPGAMEAARAYGQRRTPYAMLSRGVAGHRGKTLFVTLPGSRGGVRDSMAALFPYLFHASHVLAQSPIPPARAAGGLEKPTTTPEPTLLQRHP